MYKSFIPILKIAYGAIIASLFLSPASPAFALQYWELFQPQVLGETIHAAQSLVNNRSLIISVTPKDFKDGKWNYEIVWNRTLDKQGSVYLNNTPLVVAASKQGSVFTGNILPALSRSKLEFYSLPNKKGLLLARKYFTVLATPATAAAAPSFTCPDKTTNAFTACYYAGMNFESLKATSTVNSINFNWEMGGPSAAMSADFFSARYEGEFNFDAAEYVFTVIADDGVKLYIDNQLLISQWKDQPPTTYTASKTLTAGPHSVKMEYYEKTVGAVAKLSWTKGASSNPVPAQDPAPAPDPAPVFAPSSTFQSNIPSTYPAPLRVFDVGPGKQYESFASVPMDKLKPGDMIKVYWRQEPYREKFVLGTSGTASAPIVLTGVLGPNGERPVIDGENAREHPALDYWNMERGIIKVGGSSIPGDTVVKYIFIENLEVRNAKIGKKSYGKNTLTLWPYESNAAGIYVEQAENLVIRNCDVHDNGNGIFIGSPVNTPSRNVLITGNYIHDNSYFGDGQHHNVYVSGINMVFEYNYMKLGRDFGNNIKDRSAYLTVRYNWIEGGNRTIDAVNSGLIDKVTKESGAFPEDLVYGNVLVKLNGYDNDQIIHWGGDIDVDKPQNWRKKVSIFNNTIIVKRTSQAVGFWLDKDMKADIFNNLVYAPEIPYYGIDLIGGSGTAEITLKNNWISKGRCDSTGNSLLFCARKVAGGSTVKYIDGGGNIFGDDPLLADAANDDYKPKGDSPLLDKSAPIAGISLDKQYLKHLGVEVRITGGLPDVGAFEKP